MNIFRRRAGREQSTERPRELPEGAEVVETRLGPTIGALKYFIQLVKPAPVERDPAELTAEQIREKRRRKPKRKHQKRGKRVEAAEPEREPGDLFIDTGPSDAGDPPLHPLPERLGGPIPLSEFVRSRR